MIKELAIYDLLQSGFFSVQLFLRTRQRTIYMWYMRDPDFIYNRPNTAKKKFDLGNMSGCQDILNNCLSNYC